MSRTMKSKKSSTSCSIFGISRSFILICHLLFNLIAVVPSIAIIHFAVDYSDSDSKAPSRRQRLSPAPNVKNSGKQRDKSMAGKQKQEHFY